jgi:hypothetical protein
MKTKSYLLIIMGLIMMTSSCKISQNSMKYPNYHIEFYKSDFEYSGQASAEAKSTRVFGIDWKRIFKWETGTIESDRFTDQKQYTSITSIVNADPIIGTISTVIPVLGDVSKGKVSNYALYKLMLENPGYDVVIYPRYESKRILVPFIYSKRTVKVTARLGKIK